jgi:hypothetical protein
MLQVEIGEEDSGSKLKRFCVKAKLCTLQILFAEFGGKGDH